MHGETAAVASYARRAVKDKDSGKPLEPIAQKMNEMVQKYYDTSRPAYCARHGFVDQEPLSARYRADALTHPVAALFPAARWALSGLEGLRN